MSDTLLDFADRDEQAGFRLDYFELLNWGTFDRRVWRLNAGGENTLLTGDIGSGKSTLVDAIATLLVPPQRLAYNKAAGASARERSLRSYILGHFKSERSEAGLSAKAVALRDHNSYSVILGTFKNEGFNLRHCLAQVFWTKDQVGQPARFYVIADRPLAIAEDFANFGPDIAELRKRLRQSPGVELFDSFAAYAAAFRRLFGIDNEQALELFNQTVSLKSVGDLTDFVREHMLEAFDGEQRIEALIHHFDDLNRAHDAVLKAKKQTAALEPIVEDCARHDELAAGREALRVARDALKSWFARNKLTLLDKRLARLATENERLVARIRGADEDRARLHADRDEIKQAIAANGGDRIERLALDIRAAADERDRRRGRLERYAAPAADLSLSLPADADGFARNRGELSSLREALVSREAELQNERTELEVDFRNRKEERDALARELDSLRRRRSNIPETQVAIRERLGASLGIPPERLSFAGELLRVRAAEAPWEGAAERLLHGFALSLLVPEEEYARVSAWVDDNQLKGRLVYFRARAQADLHETELNPDSLVRKLEVKREAPSRPGLSASSPDASITPAAAPSSSSTASVRRLPATARSRARASATKRTIALAWTIGADTCSAGPTRRSAPLWKNKAQELKSRCGRRPMASQLCKPHAEPAGPSGHPPAAGGISENFAGA